MTRKELNAFFKSFKYKKHVFKIRSIGKDKVQITGSAILKDIRTGKNQEFSDSRDMKFTDFNEFELLNYMRNWLMNLAIHENDEHIVFDGRRPFNPHKVWSHIMEL